MSLPRHRTFVVSYAHDADPAHGHVHGRIEHVDSGRERHFGSQRELDAFVLEVLQETAAGPPDGEGEPEDAGGW